jgi:enediyne biosynthesis protein E4
VRSGINKWAIGVAVVLAAGAVVAICLPRRGQDPTTPPNTDPPAEAPLFRDVTSESGIDFTYRNGEAAGHYAILESLGGGVALIDYDGDGLLDVFVTGGGFFDGPDRKEIKGHPCKLYKNLGGWRFRDVTDEVGLNTVGGKPWFYTHGAAVADYDNDGWPDLLVTGYGRVALFHNVKDERTGGRRFQEVTQEAGLRDEHFWGTSAAWADLDGDGYPELYVCQYVDWSFAEGHNPKCPGYTPDVARDVCPPTEFESRPHALYLNNRNGTFREVAKEAGLHASRADADYARLDFLPEANLNRLRRTDRDRDFGKGLGVVIADLNGDGKPDIYVANDTTDKFLYLNRSKPGQLRFEDVGVAAGAARDASGAPNGSMGVDVGDYDGSGRPSLLVTNYQNELPALYRNVSAKNNLFFAHSTAESGLGGVGRAYVGFGTGFVDVDGDGWDDVVIVNGHVIRHPSAASVAQRPVLARNQGAARAGEPAKFADITARAGAYFQGMHQARGLAIGDLNNDGRPDLVISHVNEPVTLLRNEAAPDRHWLGVVLRGKDHRDVVGARIILESGGRTRTCFAKGGGSYLSSGDRRLLFGLGANDTVERLTVVWPSGPEQHWDGLAVDRYWELVAGEPAARPWPKLEATGGSGR